MSNPPKSKKFEKLKNKWYQTLKDEGFEDIETEDGRLKEWDSSFGYRYDKHKSLSKIQYYRLAGQFFHEHKFITKREEIIWELHAAGRTITQIAESLKKRRIKNNYRTGVYATIKELEQTMIKNIKDDNE